MGHPWAADVATTLLVATLLDAVYPWTERVASLALEGAWPWAVAVAAFLAVRLLVAGIYLGMGAVTRAVLAPKASSSEGR